MDIFSTLDPGANYSMPKLQVILSTWVMSHLFNGRGPVHSGNGHVEEADYRKQSIYALLYALYRSVGVVESDNGEVYECTFNTWGYAWPAAWGACPTGADDPQRFGKNAYSGLFHFEAVRDYVARHDGAVHVVEMGCGTGAGAHHVCRSVLPRCTYEAVDMQEAAIQTCQRRFVPRLEGRLRATRADCVELPMAAAVADIVAVCETHVTENGGVATEEDQRFFREAVRVLKPGGMLVWGNAIPETTWKPCFAFLGDAGMELLEVCDVSPEAVDARDRDRGRVDAYVDQAIAKFPAFRIPHVGPATRREAELAMKNFYRNPGTRLYDDLATGADTYKVAVFRKATDS